MSNPLSSYMRPQDGAAEFNAIEFVVRNMLAGVSTLTLVQVVSSTNAGEVTPPGFVDIQPLVNLIDGAGKAIKHGIIYRCPVFRMQGGNNAVILDPVAGDIGIAVFADRDITSVIANKELPADKRQSNPGSFRRFSMADALYFGGVCNGLATQYVRFSAAGITIKSPTEVVLDAPRVHITAPLLDITATTAMTITTPALTVNGPALFTGDVTAAGKSVSTHYHIAPGGGGATGVPQP